MMTSRAELRARVAQSPPCPATSPRKCPTPGLGRAGASSSICAMALSLDGNLSLQHKNWKAFWMALALRCDVSEREFFSAVRWDLVVAASLGEAWASSSVWAMALSLDVNLSLQHRTRNGFGTQV